MTNLTVIFTNSPWLLFALIPAIGVALIPYFRLNKKYRRTRNRISSLVLHITIMILATLVLAGLRFDYELPKEGNEIILLVDVSESEERSETDELETSEKSSEVRDRFVKTALFMCEDNGMSVGVVTFGFDQNYCVPFTKNALEAYNAYLNADLPDQSATDIASALNYARTLFHNPDTAKIVLITDGKETDGNAKAAIRNVLAQNTKVDFVNVKTYYKDVDMQVYDVIYPDYHVKLDEECEIKAVLQSNRDNGVANVNMRDNGVFVGTVETDIYNGTIEVTFKNVKFTTAGLHEITFELQTEKEDGISENNVYTSFYDLQNFNKILVLEGVADQSENLSAMLSENDRYEVTVKNLYSDEDIKTFTVDDLRLYDQVILNNVSNYDLCPYDVRYDDAAHAALEKSNVPDGFDQMLYEYVNVYGGGLLTVGGSEAGDQDTAHAYNRKDMIRSTYQAMLPVQAIDYTPPLGVVIIIDVSGSMSARAEDDYTRLHWAKIGADACLRALSDRDYVGIMTLFQESGIDNEVILPMTSMTQEGKIREAIYGIGDNDTRGGTTYSGAIERAGLMLRTINVEKRHIIVVTDGQPGESADKYEAMARDYYLNDGTSISVVGLGVEELSPTGAKMESLAAVCTDENGVCTGRVYYCPNDDSSKIGDQMKADLNADDLKEVNYETYHPIVNLALSPLVINLKRWDNSYNRLDTTLEGYYGVKVRDSADLILTGNFDVPLYAQWKFGSGMVGSFMCDLNRVWSADFMDSEVGCEFIVNVIENLMPVESIRPVDLNIKVTEDNYTNSIAIFDVLNEGEKIVGTVTEVSSGNEESISLSEKVSSDLTVDQLAGLGFYVRKNLNPETNYSDCEFIIKKSGVYRVTLSKVNGEGAVLATYSYFKSFAYSEEYDLMLAAEDPESGSVIENLAKSSGGTIITDLDNPEDMLKDFVLTLKVSYDPRYLFIILAIILFLLDIIVRKFKFKWPHEWFKKRDEKFKK